MKSWTLKKTGVVLTTIGAITLTISMILIIVSFDAAQAEHISATDFAQSINLSLIPSKIGMPLFLSGLVFLFISWLLKPKRKSFNFIKTEIDVATMIPTKHCVLANHLFFLFLVMSLFLCRQTIAVVRAQPLSQPPHVAWDIHSDTWVATDYRTPNVVAQKVQAANQSRRSKKRTHLSCEPQPPSQETPSQPALHFLPARRYVF